MELKTVYGYNLDLFALVTDSRAGTHIQIDIRKYYTGNGHRPIDRPLILRIIESMSSAVQLARNSSSSNGLTGKLTHSQQDRGDIIVGPMSAQGELAPLLGPPQSLPPREVCSRTAYPSYWKMIGADANGKCLECGKS